MSEGIRGVHRDMIKRARIENVLDYLLIHKRARSSELAELTHSSKAAGQKFCSRLAQIRVLQQTDSSLWEIDKRFFDNPGEALAIYKDTNYSVSIRLDKSEQNGLQFVWVVNGKSREEQYPFGYYQRRIFDSKIPVYTFTKKESLTKKIIRSIKTVGNIILRRKERKNG